MPRPDPGRPAAPAQVKVISIGVEGACLLMNQRREAATGTDLRRKWQREWRTAMVGAITFHDGQQQRQGSLYAGCEAPGLPLGSGVTEAGCKRLVNRLHLSPANGRR